MRRRSSRASARSWPPGDVVESVFVLRSEIEKMAAALAADRVRLSKRIDGREGRIDSLERSNTVNTLTA